MDVPTNGVISVARRFRDACPTQSIVLVITTFMGWMWIRVADKYSWSDFPLAKVPEQLSYACAGVTWLLLMIVFEVVVFFIMVDYDDKITASIAEHWDDPQYAEARRDGEGLSMLWD
jgi:MFS superfamily sulfate permease-like transporter